MIITKKEFKEITDKVIAETKKEAAEKIFARAASKYAGVVKQIEKSPIERELYELVLITNSKKVFDEIFGEEGNEWLKKGCE